MNLGVKLATAGTENERTNGLKREAALREPSKREEGGRMNVSQLDVSMNAPIRHQRPRHPR